MPGRGGGFNPDSDISANDSFLNWHTLLWRVPRHGYLLSCGFDWGWVAEAWLGMWFTYRVSEVQTKIISKTELEVLAANPGYGVWYNEDGREIKVKFDISNMVILHTLCYSAGGIPGNTVCDSVVSPDLVPLMQPLWLKIQDVLNCQAGNSEEVWMTSHLWIINQLSSFLPASPKTPDNTTFRSAFFSIVKTEHRTVASYFYRSLLKYQNLQVMFERKLVKSSLASSSSAGVARLRRSSAEYTLH